MADTFLCTNLSKKEIHLLYVFYVENVENILIFKQTHIYGFIPNYLVNYSISVQQNLTHEKSFSPNGYSLLLTLKTNNPKKETIYEVSNEEAIKLIEKLKKIKSLIAY